MQTTNKLLDDLAKVASGALGVAAGMREEVEQAMRQRFSRVLSDMDLVSREEYEATRAMLVKARSEQEHLASRVAALETQVARLIATARPDGSPQDEQLTPNL